MSVGGEQHLPGRVTQASLVREEGVGFCFWVHDVPRMSKAAISGEVGELHYFQGGAKLSSDGVGRKYWGFYFNIYLTLYTFLFWYNV